MRTSSVNTFSGSCPSCSGVGVGFGRTPLCARTRDGAAKRKSEKIMVTTKKSVRRLNIGNSPPKKSGQLFNSDARKTTRGSPAASTKGMKAEG
ncbi:MAG: hypothetical protein LC754_16275 [Acidobacteria bacterium]|nr:hypothetical protein [Acidobacteriota bacterium]